MVTIEDKTIQEINGIASDYGMTVEFVHDPLHEERATNSQKVITLTDIIDPQHFDDLARQLSQSFPIPHNQDMFIFNLFHGIGHFELNLWPRKFEDPLMSRLDNADIDKSVNVWAFRKYSEWKEKAL